MSQQLTKSEVDDFISALEEMMNAKSDMWQERKYSNNKQLCDIEDNRYKPAKEKVRKTLYEFFRLDEKSS